ncbi:type II CAAX prenyl endopeptidase Rce1 family protein [Asticcacaulis sp. 201]|uniref:CPBP family glutamic-type intramembrane protease n=1 Tax=Asticcacaulis sp. 201 TaxID=3028787 RepID=UPI002915FBBE|nr:CPBP family glutamic-type intramembrane protease [Asticcacaulis sp. 201]MDV6332620.1 CPBP family glutamic-type intramembrane protease [Asticcacaulis sp. 201]
MIHRILRALTTWPDRRGWLECLVVSLAAAAVIAGLGLAGALIHWQPHTDGWLLRLVSVLCIPAFSEELVFRGALVPDRNDTRRPVIWIGAAVVVFMLWHVVEATFLLPNARLFLQPAFLICAGLLGLACASMRYRTSSLWPSVFLHATLVWVWQTWLGGPDIAQLMR